MFDRAYCQRVFVCVPVATWTDPFELRRLLIRFARAPAGGTVEDVDVVTIHFAKITGGAVDANWLTGDYTTVEGAFNTWWTALLGFYPTWLQLLDYRWYKDGPVFTPDDFANGPVNPAQRITARNVAATAASAAVCPPQCAVSVTKIVPIRKRWGRFYMPAPMAAQLSVDGRFAGTTTVNFRNATVTAMNTCRAASLKPVVFSRGRSAYVTHRGSTIGAHVASAYEITDIQVDDLVDVQRSRRYGAPTRRDKTTLT